MAELSAPVDGVDSAAERIDGGSDTSDNDGPWRRIAGTRVRGVLVLPEDSYRISGGQVRIDQICKEDEALLLSKETFIIGTN